MVLRKQKLLFVGDCTGQISDDLWTLHCQKLLMVFGDCTVQKNKKNVDYWRWYGTKMMAIGARTGEFLMIFGDYTENKSADLWRVH